MANYNIKWDPIQGSMGYLVEQRKDGTGTWVASTTSPNPTLYTTYLLETDANYGYDVRVSSQGTDCLPSFSYARINAGCTCAAGFTLKADGSTCVKEETTAPTILSSNYCFAASNLANTYGSFGTKLFTAGYNTDLSSTNFTLLSTTPQWKDSTGGLVGPFNRRGIWLDTDCDGTKNALTSGSQVQITHLISLTTPKTVFIGVGGDNQFTVTVNGATVAARTSNSDANNFKYWYLFPVTLAAGNNYINFSGVGDGSVNDAIAAAIYDNTASQLAAATNDSSLTILFDTKDLICLTPPTCPKVTIASCDTAHGWFLDTSAGVGSYICRRITELPCGATTTSSTTTTTTTLLS